MTDSASTYAPLVSIRNLRFRYSEDGPDILRIPALDIAGAGLTALTGPSGVGKSTLVELIAGTIREPYEGSVTVLGKEWSSLVKDADRQRQLRRVGLVPQDFGLLPGRTPQQLIQQDLADAGVPTAERQGRIASALDRMDLGGLEDREVSGLSGGQRQRVAIARMLARHVHLVIADEPTANLDASLVDESMRLFKRLATDVPVIIVTHDPRIAALCDRTVLLQSAVEASHDIRSTAKHGGGKYPKRRKAAGLVGAAGAVGAAVLFIVLALAAAHGSEHRVKLAYLGLDGGAVDLVTVPSAVGSRRRTIARVGSKCTNAGNGTCANYISARWSPDGKYLLLVQDVNPHGTYKDFFRLLLYNAKGVFLRRLAQGAASYGLDPSWSLDSDQVAFVSKADLSMSNTRSTVEAVTLAGRPRVLFRFGSTESCGGAFSSSADANFAQEAASSTLQWRTLLHTVVFSPNCLPSGLDKADTSTGVVTQLGPTGKSLSEGRLSPDGLVVAVKGPTNIDGPGPNDLVVRGSLGGGNWVTIGRGIEPTWSPDFRTIYYERQVPRRILRCSDSLGNHWSYPQFVTKLYAVDATTGKSRLVLSRYAWGFGPVQQSGKSLVFSAVSNDAGCSHGVETADAVGSTVSVLESTLTNGGRVIETTRLAAGVGLPAVQPTQ